MNCENCQSEMIPINYDDVCECYRYWCDCCGTMLNLNYSRLGNEKIWSFPKIVNNTKILIQRLFKAEAKAANVSHANRMARDEMDKIDWCEDERR